MPLVNLPGLRKISRQRRIHHLVTACGLVLSVPGIGAVLLGTLQQVATVTISSALNLLIVGVVLVAFVIVAPNGLIGLVRGTGRGMRR